MATKPNATRTIVNVDLGPAKVMALAMAQATDQSLTAFMRALVEAHVAGMDGRGKLMKAYNRELRKLKREA